MKARLIAFACHLLLSAAIVALTMAVVIGVWYPSPLFYVQDFSTVLLTLVGVDLVLGPLLTFIVYNPSKVLLKFDLVIILLIQLSALSYGVYTSFISRPVYVVYSTDRFNSVSANEYQNIDLKKVSKENRYLQTSITGPLWLGAVAPVKLTPAEKMDLEFSAALGDGLRMMPQYYVPYEKIKADALRMGKLAKDLNLDEDQAIKQLDSLKDKSLPSSLAQIRAVREWLAKLGLPLDQIILVPLKGREKFAIVALNAETGAVLDSLSQDPWWYQ
jgi:hypothetical protein